MLTAIITPLRRTPGFTADEEAAFDAQLDEATRRGLVPCHPCGKNSGQPFRVAYFQPHMIPAGWRRFGVVTHPDTPPCAA